MIERMLSYGKKLQANKDAFEAIKYVVVAMSDRLYQAHISPTCTADLFHVFNGIQNKEIWAMKSKFLDGNLLSL